MHHRHTARAFTTQPTVRTASAHWKVCWTTLGLAAGLVLTAASPTLLYADDPPRAPQAPRSPAAPTDDCSCSDAELSAFLKDFDHVSSKLKELAGEFSAADFAYRPTDEVRTVGQTFVHVAMANYWLASMLGGQLPEGFSRELEATLTDPLEIVKFYKGSVKQVFQAAKALDADALSVQVEFMGGHNQTRRDVLTILSGHAHEHLGQLAVYLRLRGGVPPWTAREGEH